MKKTLLLVLALVLGLVGCPSAPVDMGVPAPDAAPSHKVGSYQPSDFGAQNISTTGAIRVGSTVSTTGDIRGASDILVTHVVGGVDRNVIEGTAGAAVIIGDPTNGGDIVNRAPGAGIFYVQVNGVNIQTIDVTGIHPGYPITGLVSGSSPFAGMNGMTVKSMTAATATLTAAEYANSIVKITGTGANIIKFPAATDAAAYMKYCWNAGSGTLAVQDTNAVAGTLLASNTGAWFLFATSSVRALTSGI